jgi:hypothetical protein
MSRRQTGWRTKSLQYNSFLGSFVISRVGSGRPPFGSFGIFRQPPTARLGSFGSRQLQARCVPLGSFGHFMRRRHPMCRQSGPGSFGTIHRRWADNCCWVRVAISHATGADAESMSQAG